MPKGKKKKTYAQWYASLPKALQYEGDYDLRTAYNAGEGNVTKVGEVPHLSDIGKKPNHPSFSTESAFHGKNGEFGGEWGDHYFVPGASNLRGRTRAQLAEYFKREQPGYTLTDVAPSGVNTFFRRR